MIGQVTYVISSTRSVTAATAPSTLQAYAEWPISSSHGK